MKILTLNGAVKVIPTGFSWTTLFFGPIPALLRGDIKWGVIQFLVNAAIGTVTFGFGLIVTFLIFAVIYNGRYEQDLLASGWADAQGRN